MMAGERRCALPSSLAALARGPVAFLVVAGACPLALFGGALVSCATRGLTASCALEGILVSPIVLVAAGAIAALLIRGWAGLTLVVAAVIAGMVSIPLLASAAGNPVPIDPVQGVIATIWFLPPVMIGYAVARGVARLAAGRHGGSTGH